VVLNNLQGVHDIGSQLARCKGILIVLM